MVAQGTFRQDLFFRINVVPMHIPPLRERPDVIPQLARLLLRRLRAALTQGPVDIDPDAMALLQKQPWSGNIRELEHSLERACVLVGGPSLRASDLTWLGNPAAALLSGVSAGPWFPPQPPDNAVDISGPPLSPLDEAERKALQHVLEQHRWNFTRAATALQISRSSLYMKAKRYGLTRTANLLASESASLPVVGSV
jgi:DNA-binding NtrC family response regulator